MDNAMRNKLIPEVDTELCTGCGLCLQVCPSESLSIINDHAVAEDKGCMACGHCAAVCPVGAIQVQALQNHPAFKSFIVDDRWLPHGQFDPAVLARFMGSRRSCRNYTDRTVDRLLLEDLIQFGATAPSGTNCQMWTFTVLSDRKQVSAMGSRVAGYFRKLNRLAEKWPARLWSKLFGNDELGRYYRSYYQTMEEGLAEWENTGRDRLFHGATATILVGSKPGASCPMEDALLATQNILLAAHAMGLGTCLIGFAVAAIKRDPKIKRMLAIPADEKIYAVIALGHPDELYVKTAGRKKVTPRYPDL